MNETFDPITLLMIAAAVIVFFKLRSVLGQKTGHQEQFDPFKKPESSEKQNPIPAPEAEQNEDNVVQMPGTKPQPDLDSEVDSQNNVENPPVFFDEFEKIKKRDHDFDPVSFLTGARGAYEMIVTGFADGNKKSLKALLSKEVFVGFSSAIDDRKQQQAEMTTQFIGIEEANIVNVELEGSSALITAKFVSELVSAVKDKSGTVIEGDETQVQKITDVWTFERKLGSRDPNWRLVATDNDT